VKNIFIFFGLFAITTATFASCPYGWTLTDTMDFSTSCPLGYNESSDFVLVEAGEDCPTGFSQNNDIAAIVCDPSRGTCCDISFSCSPL